MVDGCLNEELMAKSLGLSKSALYYLNSIAGTFGYGDIRNYFNGEYGKDLPKILVNTVRMARLLKSRSIEGLERLDDKLGKLSDGLKIETLNPRFYGTAFRYIAGKLSTYADKSEEFIYNRFGELIDTYFESSSESGVNKNL